MRKYGEIAKAFGFGEMELKVCRSGEGNFKAMEAVYALIP